MGKNGLTRNLGHVDPRQKPNKSHRFFGVLLFAIFVLLAISVTASAATFVVNSTSDMPDYRPGDGACSVGAAPGFGGPVCTLRAAIMEANALGGANTIMLRPGIYTITIPGQNEDAGAAGDFDIRSDLTITGSGASSTIIDGGGLDRVFDVHSGNVKISGVTIRNGNPGSENGGGILNSGTLTLTNSVVSGNVAQLGSGILNSGTLTLVRSSVSANSAGAGGLSNFSGRVTLTESTVSNNTSIFDSGGISNFSGALTLTNSMVIGNTASGGDGGGILSVLGTLDLENSTVSGNSASNNGGGIVVNSGTMNLTSSTVSSNAAVTGAGLFNISGTMTLSNSTVSGNSATNAGGGMFNTNVDSTIIVTNGTVSANSAVTGSGIFNNAVVGEVIVENSLVGRNFGNNCVGTITSNGHNLEDADTCGLRSLGDIINTDPLLGPLADNGGPTFTHALLPGSPAIDAGNNSVCPATDQRGIARPQDGNGDGIAICDIGAFEVGLSGLSISGMVRTRSGMPLAGVSVALTGVVSRLTTTDTNGNYTFAGLVNGSYTMTPSKFGSSFAPSSRSVTISGANVAGQSFTVN